MKHDILDIFYNHILKEAIYGQVDCYFQPFLPLNISFKESNKNYNCKLNDKDLDIPTLRITNFNHFNNLLIKYVNLAAEFYSESNYPIEILNDAEYEETKKICKEKWLLTHLWANATIADYYEPEKYLEKRISFLENSEKNKFVELGFSHILKGNLFLEIKEDKITNETPNQLVATIINPDTLETYQFPALKFGVYDNKIYIYSIQNCFKETNNYAKQINRFLYKIGEGFVESNDDNLKDITASFLIVGDIASHYFLSQGFSEFIVPTYLVARWNSKILETKRKASLQNNKLLYLKQELLKQEMLYRNLIDKFLRTFRRLDYHFHNIEILSNPFESDSINSNLIYKFNNSKIVCNNSLLKEIALLSAGDIPDKNIKK